MRIEVASGGVGQEALRSTPITEKADLLMIAVSNNQLAAQT
jgi:hypothetical protein